MKVLLAAGADVHARDDEALRMAAERGYTEIVKVLVDQGTNVHAVNASALRMAAKNGHTETVNVLLAAGANVDARNDDALWLAALNGHAETVKVLLQAGADPRAALRAAREEKPRKALELLIDRKNKLNGEAEYASWMKVLAPPDRCPQCGRGIARLPMVSL